MRHFISFQKKKALYIDPGDANNTALAHELNHELMAVGYVLSKDAFEAAASLDVEGLTVLYGDLVAGLRRVVGDAGYEPIYRNFPQSVLAMAYEEFAINALVHYWSYGTWRPKDAAHIHREFRIEAVDYTQVGLLTKTKFDRIFHDLLYGKVSLSAFDKTCVDWYLDQGGDLAFSRVSFKETASHVGKRLLDSSLEVLPIRRANTVLRIWSAYSGGDEGLKENTRFKSPSKRQRALLMRTLEGCSELEDDFKGQRERWLRLLFLLHPNTAQHRERYPRLAEYADRLRNQPKTLRTFNSRVESAIARRDPTVLDLLARRPGMFMRRLDHLVRTFDVEAFDRWLQLEPRFDQLVTAYNHFSRRAETQGTRGAVLASAKRSELVTYKALGPLPEQVVAHITEQLLQRLRRFEAPELGGTIFVEPGLYYTPLATNNRASALTLDSSKAIGTSKRYTQQATLRLYAHWEGRSDIDLSGFSISRHNEVIKVGWNAAHHAADYIVYSGDNTGLSEKNAEYIDINTSVVPDDIDWIIVEARIFRGPTNFAGYQGTAHMGWMSRAHPEAGKHWLPKTLEHAMVLTNDAKVAYLMAYHPRSKNIVFLDMSIGTAQVSTPQDALQMRAFLERFVTLDEERAEIPWETLNQGHILELLAPEIAADKASAEIVFDEHTTAEQVSRLMTSSTPKA